MPLPSTAISSAAQNDASSHAADNTEVSRPGLWLLLILVLALALRCWHIDEFQQDEFGPLYAVAQRQGLAPDLTPTAENKLAPVSTWQEVRERSILPYGIENPYPLYHYLLYAVVHVLPIAEWSLRVPSLIAGLGCVVGIYFLCRRLIGTEVALVAALLAAADPSQVVTSAMARPYALANLACVWSFFFLLIIRQARATVGAVAAAAGYGVCMAFVGYMNPILLFVGIAHAGLVANWFLDGLRLTTLRRSVGHTLLRSVVKRGAIVLPRALLCLAGCGIAGVLLVPELGYIREVQQFSHAHREYLSNLQIGSGFLKIFVLHNSTLLVALLVVSITGYVIRRSTAEFSDASQKREDIRFYEASLNGGLPDNPALLWLGRCWLFLPQVFPLVLSFAAGQPMFLGRYLSYTMLGGAILLAHWATRDRSREIRLGLSAALALTMFLLGLTSWITDRTGLTTRTGYTKSREMIVQKLDELNDQGQPRWQNGDVVLVRSGFLEADSLDGEIPQQSRTRVEAAILAPFTILSEGKTHKELIVLTYSNYREADIKTFAGKQKLMEEFYSEKLAEQLRGHDRFWYRSLPGSTDEDRFLECFLPWLATALDSDLKVARNRVGEEHYFVVKKNLSPLERVPELKDTKVTDFIPLILIRAPANQRSEVRGQRSDTRPLTSDL